MQISTIRCHPRLLAGAAAMLLCVGTILTPVLAEQAQTPRIPLPAVSGPFGVGTLVWHWMGGRSGDSRPDYAEPPLEVMVQLWYPADTVSGPGATRYRPLGGDDFEPVAQHAMGAAPFASTGQSTPLIVICPGRGTNRYYYTSIAEELASRGFAVFAVDIPAIGYVEYPDGRTVKPSDAFRPSFELITGPYEKVDEFFEPAVTLGLEHLRFALRNLAVLAVDDPAGILTGRLDMQRIGAFGHSLGGRICGALTASDARVAALATMEGVPPRMARRVGLSAASLMLYSSELPEDMALPNIRELYDNRKAEATILRLEGFGHNSVTDRPLIFRDSYDYAIDPGRAIDLTRRILSAFFTAHLGSGKFDVRGLAEEPEITIIESSIDSGG